MSVTLRAPARFEIEVRKSRFLAQAMSVATVDAVPAFFASVSDRDATHNCWAWRIGAQYRFSDDGEPAGTAGRPILAALDGQGLDQVAVVVTRWYGGIKLGAGGLARAYGGSAAECLRRAERVPLIRLSRLSIRCGFEHLGVVHALFEPHCAHKLREQFFDDGVALRIELPADRVDALRVALRDAGRGRIDCTEVE